MGSRRMAGSLWKACELNQLENEPTDLDQTGRHAPLKPATRMPSWAIRCLHNRSRIRYGLQGYAEQRLRFFQTFAPGAGGNRQQSLIALPKLRPGRVARRKGGVQLGTQAVELGKQAC